MVKHVGSALACALVLLALSAPFSGQEKEDSDSQPGETVDVDFVRKEKVVDVDYVKVSLRWLLCELARKGGVAIEIAPDVPDIEVSVIHRRVKLLDVVRSICKAHKIKLVTGKDKWRVELDGDAVRTSHVEQSTHPGRFDASFQNHDYLAAILEIAGAALVDAFVPADAPDPNKAVARISIAAHDATADYLMREIARQVGLKVTYTRKTDESGGVREGYSFARPDEEANDH